MKKCLVGLMVIVTLLGFTGRNGGGSSSNEKTEKNKQYGQNRSHNTKHSYFTKKKMGKQCLQKST